MKKVLITGANSYIGDSVRDYLLKWPDEYVVSIKDTIGWNPEPVDFNEYDVVFNVAGIAHVKETSQNRHLYYEINRNLVIKIANAAKQGGIKQFILLSSMSVYGLVVGHISKTTPINPTNAYGKSKAEADEAIKKLEDKNFKFACLRPPMVYGKGCKGNYQTLRKFALKSPIFPDFKNQRSMIYIGNLCEFVKQTIDLEKEGLFFPQNSEYVSTCEMVKQIAELHDRRIKLAHVFNWAIRVTPLNLIKKIFGNLTYESVDVVEHFDFFNSMKMSEE